MGIRDFLQRKREQHGGLRRYAASKLKGEGAPSEAPRTEPVEAQQSAGALPKAPDSQGRVAVARAEELSEGQGRAFRAGEHAVAVFRAGGALYAIDSACTHEDGPLDEGELDGLIVTCPYHDWRFSVESGECLSHEDRAVACYSVVEAGGFIWVGGRTSEGSAERGGAHDDGLETVVRDV